MSIHSKVTLLLAVLFLRRNEIKSGRRIKKQSERKRVEHKRASSLDCRRVDAG